MVLIIFTIGGTTKFSTKLNLTAQELLSGESEENINSNKKQKFKIPLPVCKLIFKLISRAKSIVLLKMKIRMN